MGPLTLTEKRLCASMALLFAMLMPCTMTKAQTLSARVESPQEEFVIGELLKCFVTLTNDSPDTIRVVDIGELDMNMTFMFIEVTSPEGVTEIRKTRYLHKLVSRWPQGYLGEPLAPSDSLQIFLYPNWSMRLRSEQRRQSLESGSRTFSAAGTYVIRFCYDVPLKYKRVWKAPGGKCYSNPITLRFREPTVEEKRILEPLWAAGSLALTIGDGKDWSGFDEEGLDKVIAGYPAHPLTKYAYFAMARCLVTPKSLGSIDAARTERGLELCAVLMRSYPGFRYEETRQHMANGLYRLGRQEEAVRLLKRTLEERPGLKDNLSFMRDKIFFETGSLEAVGIWQMKRSQPHLNLEQPENEQE